MRHACPNAADPAAMPIAGRISTSMETEIDHRRRARERERELLRLAERQHGVVALAQLRSIGMSPSGVRSRVAAGRLHRVHSGVYAVGRPDLAVEGRWMAAVLASGRGAVLSHQSAAALHGLLASARTTIDIAVPRRSGRSRPGIRIHRLTRMPSADVVSVRAIPCTSVARTLLDLSGVVDWGSLSRACDQAEVLRVLDITAVNDAISRAPRRPGVRSLRAVLGTGRVGEDRPAQRAGGALPRPLPASEVAAAERQRVDDAGRRADPGGFPVARSWDDRRDRWLSHPPHPPSLRARPPARPAPES